MQTLKVIIDSNRNSNFCTILTNNIFVQVGLNVFRTWYFFFTLLNYLLGLFSVEDLISYIYTLIADINILSTKLRTLNYLLNLMPTLITE